MSRAWHPAEFAPVLARLEANQARYVVVGGVAVNVHGLFRMVGDLDIAVYTDGAHERLLMRVLADSGYFPTIPLGLAELTMLRTLDSDGREVNLLARTSIPFSELWAASVIRAVGGVAARVACLDHVLRIKRQSGRPEDLAEVEVLLGSHKTSE